MKYFPQQINCFDSKVWTNPFRSNGKYLNTGQKYVKASAGTEGIFAGYGLGVYAELDYAVRELRTENGFWIPGGG